MMIIAVENIGAGKSTLLTTLERMGHTVVKEPVEAWSHWLNGGGDQAFFQCIVLAWYIAVGRRLKGNAIIERSPFSAEMIFAKGCDFGNLKDLHQTLVQRANEVLKIDAYVFLPTPPSVCKQRLESRKQAGDDGLSVEKLVELDVLHWQAIYELVEQRKAVYVFDFIFVLKVET